MTALTIEVRLLPTAIGFGIAFGFAAYNPDWWAYAKSLGALVFAINVGWAWRERRDHDRSAASRP